MKSSIQPKLNKITVNCNCGHSFETHSTLEVLKVDMCSNCHPFYTGTEKLIDTEGRIDKFNRRRTLAQQPKTEKNNKSQNNSQTQYKPSLKEIFNQNSEN
jgi:large subunit ribosomal protein L31